MSTFLLYAVVPADRLPPSAGAPVSLSVLAGESVGLVYAERDEPPPAGRQEVVAFGEVVQKIAEEGPTLPVRFGTTLESLAEARDLLERREAEWRDRLSAVAGHVEILVHARDLDSPVPAAAAPGRGREYLMSRAAARRHTETLLEDLTESLSPRCRELRRLRSSDEVRVACLVPAGGTDAFRSALDAWAGGREGVEVTTTGPWPPFSFTEKEPG